MCYLYSHTHTHTLSLLLSLSHTHITSVQEMLAAVCQCRPVAALRAIRAGHAPHARTLVAVFSGEAGQSRVDEYKSDTAGDIAGTRVSRRPMAAPQNCGAFGSLKCGMIPPFDLTV